ncbi:MAG: carbohydrate ABC transporter permease [Spirochaetales bacterium]|nr:carbohydrate ABC transporter permease [Spirochaetales bacterium]
MGLKRKTTPVNLSMSIFRYMVLGFFSLLFLFPFYYVFVLASNDIKTIYNTPPPFLIGPNMTNNFIIMLQTIPVLRYFFNSLMIAVLAVSTKIFFCTLTGFVLAKYNFKGRKLIFAVILFTLTTPRFLNIIPLFQMMVWFKWVNTYLPLFIPSMADGLGIFLMTQLIRKTAPDELLDAARSDGYSEYQIALRLGFPLAKSGIALLGTIAFAASWNDFMYALVMLPGHDLQTIPLALAKINWTSEKNIPVLMLFNGLSIVPVVLVFIIFSKQIISNMLAGSIKG